MSILFLFNVSSFAFAEESYIDKSFKKAADKMNVPEPLLRAICFAESKHNRYAYAHGDGGEQNPALGICQVLLSTGKNLLGLNQEEQDQCKRDFRSEKQLRKAGILDEENVDQVLSRTYQECKLFGPYTNMYAAAKLLKNLLNRYNGSWVSAVAAYNSGRPKPCPSKGHLKTISGIVIECTPGGLLNQKYVDRVMKSLQDQK